ncbi:hypothetical protein [Spirosoma aerophilum]
MSTKYTTILLAVLAHVFLLVACNDHIVTLRSVSFDETFTTTNEELNPALAPKQRTSGTSSAESLNIHKFITVATSTRAPHHLLI